MGLFDAFRKSPKERQAEEARKRAAREDLDVYSGMRVEVTSGDGRIFLVARLSDLRGDRAQLEPGANGSLLTWSDKPQPVTLRGYSSKEGRTVIMEGTIRMGANRLWQAERLGLVEQSEQRANIRVGTDLMGSFTLIDRPSVPEECCQIKNIGMGGACIGSQARRDVGDKLSVWVEQLLELEDVPLTCQILRIDNRKPGYFEYGCRFVDLSEETERHLFRAVYALYHGLY